MRSGNDLVVAAADATEARPVISGRTVVYFSIDSGDPAGVVIKARSLDVAAPVEAMRLDAELALYDLLFDNGRLVVYELKCIRTAICSWRLRTAAIGGPPSVIANGDGWLLGVDFKGETVAYVEHSDHDRLYAANIQGGEPRLLADVGALGPTSDGRFVFWSAREREDSSVTSGALMGYDLRTGSRFLAAPGDVSHYSLHLRNDRLVWSEGFEPAATRC